MAKGSVQADGAPASAPTERDMQHDTELTARSLKKQPTKTVMLAPGDTARGMRVADVSVTVNGHTFQIQRGVEVEVPETVYEVLKNARAAVDTDGQPLRPELF